MPVRGIEVSQPSVEAKIQELSDVCEDIKLCKSRIDGISSGYCTGPYFDKYMQSVEDISNVMGYTVNMINGYISALRFATDSYQTVDSDLITAIVQD